MKRILIITFLYLILLTGLILFLSLPQRANVENYEEIMGTSNQLYEMEEYELAADGYQQLSDQGMVDAALYYNLGNTSYKTGDIGQAVLYYLRAQHIDPRDEDIRANLELVRSLRVDKIDENSQAKSTNPLTSFTEQWLTRNELAGIAISLWYVLSVLIILLFNTRPGTRSREISVYAVLLAAVLFLSATISLGSQIIGEKTQPRAVILVDEIDVTSGPGTQYITEFTLHSGTEVNLLETRVNWDRISLPGGELQGWVPVDTLELVMPAAE